MLFRRAEIFASSKQSKSTACSDSCFRTWNWKGRRQIFFEKTDQGSSKSTTYSGPPLRDCEKTSLARLFILRYAADDVWPRQTSRQTVPQTVWSNPTASFYGRERQQKSRQNGGSFIGVPYGIRTRVTAVRGRCPRPLDEGDKWRPSYNFLSHNARCLLAFMPFSPQMLTLFLLFGVDFTVKRIQNFNNFM